MVYIMFHISAERVRQPRPHYNKIKLLISSRSFFFFNDPATTEIYPFPLHDALPISTSHGAFSQPRHGLGGAGGGETKLAPDSEKASRRSSAWSRSLLYLLELPRADPEEVEDRVEIGRAHV